MDDESDKMIKGIAKAHGAEDRTYKEDVFIPQSKLYKKQFKLLRKNSTL